MTFAAIRLLLGKAPVWVWGIVVALIIAGLLYVAGARHEATKLHREALADSVVVARAVKDTAVKKADSVVVIANVEEKKGTPLRQRARIVIADTSNHVPPAVIALVDSALAQDSTTIAKKDDALAAKERVIDADAKLDTLTEHQLVFKPPGDGLSVTGVLETTGKVAVVAGVLCEGVRAARWLLRTIHR